MTDTTARRYSAGAMIFHWLIAILVIANWQIVERAHDFEGAMRGTVMGYHKAVGITILVLTVGRLLWRSTHKVPPLPSDLAGWEKTLARTVHVIFYVLLIALPLGGWLANSLTGRSIDFFGLFTIPPLPVGENGDLAGRKIVVTAGGTQEPIDPVRVITNNSSGKMGFALAEAARDRGADVVLITAPTDLRDPPLVRVTRVQTAQQMCDTVLHGVKQADVLIMAAAVADFRPAHPDSKKLKKELT